MGEFTLRLCLRRKPGRIDLWWFAVRPCLRRKPGQIGKSLEPIHGRSARAITHLIPEVRP